ncbi:hypothetical protein AWB78_05796 [Caballeronia calidae]|uniref:Uncharacterized protein n=1 Tax=Caballeronia calidae TaxID=1777139 RepID=A0A158DY56_9BURK|nr:hypothetical protein [Caballeronia calidae]SAK99542.1 hypothetical protein AWB78_05796 [Caballeronia calidae]
MQTDVLKMARQSGMTILLDGRIGQQAYTSVSGSADALQRFAHDVRASLMKHSRRKVRAARSPCVNPLVTARMRERIAGRPAYRDAGARQPRRLALRRRSSVARLAPE